jgi:arylformamidase
MDLNPERALDISMPIHPGMLHWGRRNPHRRARPLHRRRQDRRPAGPRRPDRTRPKTTNSATALRSPWKSTSWVGLDGARLLLEAGVQLAAIDYLTIEAVDYTTDWDTHVLLCSNDVLILEVADLLDVEPGVYDMVSLPIPLQGAEAAPSRTLLWPR